MINELIEKITIASGESVTAQKVVELINGGVKDVDADTITPATATVFESASTYYISAVALSETKVLVAYTDNGNSYYGTAIILNISDNTITPATAAVFESAKTTYISAVVLSETKVLVAYRDEGNSNYGTANICKILPSNIIGISKTTASSGKADISFGQLIGGFSGLTQGAYQYVANNGTLTETPEIVKTPVAIAINSTTIKWLNPII